MLLTEKDYLKNLDIKIVIISRGRHKTITTHKLLPDYIEIVVPDDEIDLYKETVSNPLVAIPKEIQGLGNVRNWCLDYFKEETLIMLDDDIHKVYCITGEKARNIDDKEELVQIFINDAVMAKDAGLHCFGYTQTDIRKYKGTDPFSLCTWVGCFMGVIGRMHKFRNDKFKVDIDFCLKNLLVDRIIWVDNMYYFIQKRDSNSGGNSLYRTEDEYNKSLESLKKKWGRFLTQSKAHKSQISLKLNVNRKQVIDYEE